MTAIQNIQSSAEEPVGLSPTDLYSDEPPLGSDLHLRQILLLLSSLEWLWRDRQDFFASGSLTIYFSPKQLKSRDVRGPDFFVVLGTERRSPPMSRATCGASSWDYFWTFMMAGSAFLPQRAHWFDPQKKRLARQPNRSTAWQKNSKNSALTLNLSRFHDG